MARKKKFDGQAGFLWSQEGIKRVEAIADARTLTPSDIYREAMAIYFAIQEGTAKITYTSTQVLIQAPEQVEQKAAVSPTPEAEKAGPKPEPA